MKRIAVVIPCHNEESGIGKVLESIPFARLEHLGFLLTVIVVDNNSTDKTSEVAATYGVTVVSEHKKGKGYAIRKGLSIVPSDCDFVVMLDGDDTYKPQELYRMIEPLESGFADVILGSRLSGDIRDGSLTMSKRFVNWGFTFLVRTFYVANITDVLSGYFAWRKDVIDELLPHLASDGFAIEMEMITKMRKMGFRIFSVPITYDRRSGESKIIAFKDGGKIFLEFIKNSVWSPRKKQILSL